MILADNRDFLSTGSLVLFPAAEVLDPRTPRAALCPPPCTGTRTSTCTFSWAVDLHRLLGLCLLSTRTALLDLLHNCGRRYFSPGSLNRDSRDKFLLEFSSRKCLVSADVYMLPVVSTWKRHKSMFFSLEQAKNVKSNIWPQFALHWHREILNPSISFRMGLFYFLYSSFTFWPEMCKLL